MTVYLVGAGPGDPELLTVKGAEVLRRADVVIYDRLSVTSLVDLAPPDAERISVRHPEGPPEEWSVLEVVPSDQMPERMRALVVDDDYDVRTFLAGVLAKQGVSEAMFYNSIWQYRSAIDSDPNRRS